MFDGLLIISAKYNAQQMKENYSVTLIILLSPRHLFLPSKNEGKWMFMFYIIL